MVVELATGADNAAAKGEGHIGDVREVSMGGGREAASCKRRDFLETKRAATRLLQLLAAPFPSLLISGT